MSSVLDRNVIDAAIVNAGSEGLIFLLREEKPYTSRRGRGTNDSGSEGILHIVLHGFAFWSKEKEQPTPGWGATW